MFSSGVLILKIMVPVGPHVVIDPADVRLAWFTNRVETGPHCPGRLGSQQVHAWRLPVQCADEMVPHFPRFVSCGTLSLTFSHLFIAVLCTGKGSFKLNLTTVETPECLTVHPQTS